MPKLSDSDDNLTSTIELYDPLKRQSEIVGQLQTARMEPELELSTGNTVFIIGGDTDKYCDAASDAHITSTELYLGKQKKARKYPEFLSWWQISVPLKDLFGLRAPDG